MIRSAGYAPLIVRRLFAGRKPQTHHFKYVLAVAVPRYGSPTLSDQVRYRTAAPLSVLPLLSGLNGGDYLVRELRHENFNSRLSDC